LQKYLIIQSFKWSRAWSDYVVPTFTSFRLDFTLRTCEPQSFPDFAFSFPEELKPLLIA